MTMSNNHGETTAASYAVGLALALGALLGLFLTARAVDPVMVWHGILFLVFCAGGIFLLSRWQTAASRNGVD